MRIGLPLLIILLSGPLYAQCVTTCSADTPKDEQGCCIVASTASVASKAKDPMAACSTGKERSQYTAGHCCWPEQEWSAKEDKCTGTPTCPEGLVPIGTDCGCPTGMSITDFTSGHCCWPEQEWSAKAAQCTGTPNCPRDFEKDGTACKKIIRGTLTLIVTGGKQCLFTLNGRRIRPYPFNSIREEVAIGTYTAGCIRDGHELLTKTVTVPTEGKKVLFRVR